MNCKDAGIAGGLSAPERDVLRLSSREWLLVSLGVLGILVCFPTLRLQDRVTAVEPDYRIPYSLSHRYRLYRHYTNVASLQYPALVVGDSVVWGQCALRHRTLSHYLNEHVGGHRFANAGLDAMHPIALESLLEYHAPSVTRKSVVLQFNPLWLMSQGEVSAQGGEPLRNRPNLVPRLASGIQSSRKLLVEDAWSRVAKVELWNRPIERVLESQVDVLAWSISHPYENPSQILSSPLPPSEDTFSPRLEAWNSGTNPTTVDCFWPDPRHHGQWQAFERILDRLESRGNRVLVMVGPINEHMLTPAGRESYRVFLDAVRNLLVSRKAPFYVPPLLPPDRFADICHPLAPGYEDLARLLLKDQAEWLEGIPMLR